MREFKRKRKKIYSARNYQVSRVECKTEFHCVSPSQTSPPPLSPHFGFIFLRASSRVLPRSPPLIARRPTTQKLPTVCDGHDERGLAALLVLR